MHTRAVTYDRRPPSAQCGGSLPGRPGAASLGAPGMHGPLGDDGDQLPVGRMWPVLLARGQASELGCGTHSGGGESCVATALQKHTRGPGYVGEGWGRGSQAAGPQGNPLLGAAFRDGVPSVSAPVTCQVLNYQGIFPFSAAMTPRCSGSQFLHLQNGMVPPSFQDAMNRSKEYTQSSKQEVVTCKCLS